MDSDKLFELETGLEVRLIDRTRNYYGDFWHVCLDVRCEIDVDRVVAEGGLGEVDTAPLAGRTLVYRRSLEKMGVPSGELDSVREHLVANFVRHSLPYLSTPGFAGRFVLTELRRLKDRSLTGLLAIHQ